MFKNRGILITGGTGSFGKAFTRTLLERYPGIHRLVVYSRDELKQFEMAQEFETADFAGLRYFIGDVRDRDRLRRAMEGIDTVVHAAALKQVPAAEYNPFEAVKTNVLGAQNVIECALDSGVSRVVALSTDKAAAPINLYGATKLCSDKLFTAANNIRGKRDIRFSVVRYGNVMGSRGSVIPFFLSRRETGILPITDPRMTRFNISLQEGVEMVLWAIEHTEGGELFVPKIPSYRITDVAEAIGPECEKPLTGLRPGEKIHEEMITASDSYYTVDMGKYFAILSTIGNLVPESFCERNGYRLVEPGFSYNSGENDRFLTVEEIRGLIRQHIDPGFTVQTVIPYGCQQISEADIEAVVEVLRSDFLTQGPVVPQFEQAVARRVGADHAVAVNSGTSALHIACAALDLGPGDWLWTSPITFVASANCARYCGAEVDFVDIDPETFNMCPDALERKLAEAEAESDGKLPKVIIPVHMCGQSPDMARISEIAHRYGVRIIEDASHAIGARYQGQPVGDCTHCDITVFSFHAVKIITTGEGGLLTTKDCKLAERMARLRSHGITRDPVRMTREPDGPWYYEQLELGWNYRMTEMQGALGLSQMSRLDDFLRRRRELAERYDEELASLPLRLPGRQAEAESSWHLYVVRLKEAERRRPVFESLRAAGIGVNLHYIPVHLQPDYERSGFRRGDFAAAENYYDHAITIPLHPGLEPDDQINIVRALSKAVSA